MVELSGLLRATHSSRGARCGVLLVALIIASAALFSWPLGASAMENAVCVSCHDSSMDMSVPAVDRNVACNSCHLGFAGSHPLHQAGSNCGAACHPQWGDSLLTATPRYTDPISGAAFASAASKSTPAEELHVIHSAARWPSGVSTPGSACASCHSAAACEACHTGAVSVTHAAHSSAGNGGLSAREPWTGTVGYGVVGGDQSQRSAFPETNQCATAGCHDLARTQAARPRFVEDYNHAVGGNPDDPAISSSAISTIGTWRTRSNAIYSGNRMSYSNAAGSVFSAAFTGGRVEIVSDTDPYRGQAEIFIDGALAGSIDCYAPMTQTQRTVAGFDVAQGAHTIEVRPTGLKNTSARGAFVVVDAFNVYPTSRGSISPTCTSCHPGEDARHEALHVTAVSHSCGWRGCHSGDNLVPLHINAGTALDCETCHESADSDVTGAIAASDKDCGSCHEVQPHPSFNAAHTSVTGDGCFGVGCHDLAKNLATVHAAYAGPGSERPQYSNACELCHDNPAVNTTTSGTACTGSCHGGATHMNMNPGHAVTAASAACTGCHGTNLNSIHDAFTDLTRCGWCHAQPDNWSKGGNCVNCHSMTAPHPGQAAEHAATSMGGGDIYMGLTDGDHNGVSIYEECSRCHYSGLEGVHANQCQWCHTSAGTPAVLGGAWGRSCQQGGCHPAIHDALLTTDDHFDAYWNSSSSCDVCHDDGNPWPGSGDNCQVCH